MATGWPNASTSRVSRKQSRSHPHQKCQASVRPVAHGKTMSEAGSPNAIPPTLRYSVAGLKRAGLRFRLAGGPRADAEETPMDVARFDFSARAARGLLDD